MEVNKKNHTVTLPIEEYNSMLEVFEKPKKDSDYLLRFIQKLSELGIGRTTIEEAARLTNLTNNQ